MTSPALALLYRDHTEPTSGGAVHGYHVVEELRRLGYRLLTAEPKTDARLRRYPRSPRGMLALLEDADAVYVRCDARPWDLALLALNRLTTRRPVVTEVNAIAEERLAYGDHAYHQARVGVLRNYYHAIVRLSDAALCVSSALAAWVRTTYPIAPERIFVVPNGGTPLPGRTRGPRATGAPFRAVWAGGARWPWQALDLVLESGRRLRARVPDAELLVYADSPPTPLHSEPGIRIEPPVPHRQLGAVLGEAQAALCLYRPMPWSPAGFYNSPLKLFDYLASGLPVLGSRLGQIAEVIEHERSGFLVGDDPDEVAERLVSLERDPERAAAMGRAALERLESAYTWHHTGDKIGGVLEGLLADARRARSRRGSGTTGTRRGHG